MNEFNLGSLQKLVEQQSKMASELAVIDEKEQLQIHTQGRILCL